MDSSELNEIIEELHGLRSQYGMVDDDYRQARVDVAIENLNECKDVIEEYEEAGMWK